MQSMGVTATASRGSGWTRDTELVPRAGKGERGVRGHAPLVLGVSVSDLTCNSDPVKAVRSAQCSHDVDFTVVQFQCSNQ